MRAALAGVPGAVTSALAQHGQDATAEADQLCKARRTKPNAAPQSKRPGE